MRSNGFTLPDLLVALLLTLIVAGAALALVGVAQRAAAVVPEFVDQQQRLRVAAEALMRDAGAECDHRRADHRCEIDDGGRAELSEWVGVVRPDVWSGRHRLRSTRGV